jgi:fatty-acyl-CoA synthase
VMVCELDSANDGKNRDHLEARLRQRVVGHLDIALEDVRLVKERWLIKTSSGKIARAENRDKYLREFRAAGQEW